MYNIVYNYIKQQNDFANGSIIDELLDKIINIFNCSNYKLGVTMSIMCAVITPITDTKDYYIRFKKISHLLQLVRYVNLAANHFYTFRCFILDRINGDFSDYIICLVNVSYLFYLILGITS